MDANQTSLHLSQPEPLTSERMTLTMRNALDTRVVTCWADSRVRGKAEAGE